MLQSELVSRKIRSEAMSRLSLAVVMAPFRKNERIS
jgi:hypothetical protein